MLRTILIQRINCRLLHLLEILQPLRIPKKNIILVHMVSKALKNLWIFGPQEITLLIPIPITIIVCHILEKFINVDVIAIRIVTTHYWCWWCGLLSSFIYCRGCQRVLFKCTGDTQICFTVKLPDGVILEKIMPHQVRLYHTTFLETFVLIVIARTNGALPTQTHTMFFCSGNKFSHMMQERKIVANSR